MIPAPRTPHEPPIDRIAEHDPHSQRLAAYIRHIADTAPLPTPAQLERLVALLRDTGNPNASH